jgi:tryptophan halogenase
MEPSHSSEKLRIVIVGGGTAGWMCALAMARQLPRVTYGITLIESDDIGTVGVGEATLPHIKKFNDTLGIDEAQFMRETRATMKLGIEFRDWSQPGQGYIHPFGAFGEPWGGVEFQNHWIRARRSGTSSFALEDYSYAVAAARANAFDFPNEEKTSIRSTYSYAYHFDAGLYSAFLRNLAVEAGVRRIEGQVCDCAREPLTGDIKELTLKSGARIAGDLFVDCSGFRALLIEGVLGVTWQDWTHWLPCDRAYAVQCKRTRELTPYTRSTAQLAGWIWRIPLQHRIGNGYVFSSRFISDSEAQQSLVGALEGQPLGAPRLLRFSPGRRLHPWSHNCVAIGLASGFLEPLESTSIFLIQAAVMDLISLIPAPHSKHSDPRLRNEFNRLSDMQYDRVRDFLILHYMANRRFGEPLWDYVRTMAVPESLRNKLELFRSRSALPNYQFGLFARDSWLAVLIGQGIEPSNYDHMADAIPLAALDEKLTAFRERVRTNVAAMSSHSEFIETYCGLTDAAVSEGAVA